LLLGNVEVCSVRLVLRVEIAMTFNQTFGSRLNFLHEFPEAVFLRVDMESQLGDEEVRLPALE
jgi:hypothetical protein